MIPTILVQSVYQLSCHANYELGHRYHRIHGFESRLRLKFSARLSLRNCSSHVKKRQWSSNFHDSAETVYTSATFLLTVSLSPQSIHKRFSFENVHLWDGFLATSIVNTKMIKNDLNVFQNIFFYPSEHKITGFHLSV